MDISGKSRDMLDFYQAEEYMVCDVCGMEWNNIFNSECPDCLEEDFFEKLEVK